MMSRVASMNNTKSSGTCSFKSTILAGHAADIESQASSDSSYQTACSGGGLECLPIEMSIDSHRPEPPSLLNRPINPSCQPNSDLDLSCSTAESRNSDERKRNGKISEILHHGSRNEICSENNEEAGSSSIFDIEKSSSGSPRPRRNAATPSYDDSNAKILKHMSQEFMMSPQAFTERLVTIIDESETGHRCDETSGVNLSRMTKEFRKMCKYIQDESMPEIMNLTLGITSCTNDKIATTTLSRHAETSDETNEESTARDNFHTPERREMPRQPCARTPLNMFKKKENCASGSPGSPNSTKTFVYLENCLKDQNCSALSTTRGARTYNTSNDLSDRLRDKMMIVKKSEEQLASLDETGDANFETFDSHRTHGTQEHEILFSRVSSLNFNDPCIEDLDHSDNVDINEDELSMSLRMELEKKRERCFETARLIQKIEEDARRSNDDYPNALKRCGIDIDTECIKTIKFCQDYEKCWRKIHDNDNLRRNVDTRRKENDRKKEATSYHSGIDSRSVKKPQHNGASTRIASKNNDGKNIVKNSRSEVISSLRSNNMRLESRAKNKTRKPISTDNLGQGMPLKIVSTPRKRSPESTCQVAKSPAVSKCRTGEKLSSVRNPETRLGNCQTTVRERTNGNNGRLDIGTKSQYVKPVSMSNLRQGTPKKVPLTPRRRSPGYLRPSVRSLTRSRSRSGEKSSPRIISAKANHRAIGNDRIYDNRAKLRIPEVVVTTPTRCTTHPATTPRGAKSSTPKLVASALSRDSPLLRKNSAERIPKIVDCSDNSPALRRIAKTPRNKFFVTPGKSSPVKTPKKNSKMFFPTLDGDLKSINRPGNCDGPRSPVVTRFNHIESPISMYIHGTDMNLIQNVHTERDEWLLTPTKKTTNSEEKLNYNLGPTTSTPVNGKHRNRRGNDSKHSDSSLACNDENTSELEHPTVFYKPATKVCTVSPSPRKFGGARVRGLLESVENVIVIRHEKRRYEKEDSDVPASDKDPDMSVHVYTPAAKAKQN